MKILRSIGAVVVGWIVSSVVIMGLEFMNFAVYRPDDGKSLMEKMKEMEENPEAAKAFIHKMPTSALVVLLVAWQAGAFLGGAVSALIGGRARLVHAGIIGGLVLGGTVLNALSMKSKYEYSHPDWLLIAGLLLPLPASLLAGKMIAMLIPAPVSPPSIENRP